MFRYTDFHSESILSEKKKDGHLKDVKRDVGDLEAWCWSGLRTGLAVLAIFTSTNEKWMVLNCAISFTEDRIMTVNSRPGGSGYGLGETEPEGAMRRTVLRTTERGKPGKKARGGQPRWQLLGSSPVSSACS
jgi:hypothetical protein